jgi:hypothetical protein
MSMIGCWSGMRNAIRLLLPLREGVPGPELAALAGGHHAARVVAERTAQAAASTTEVVLLLAGEVDDRDVLELAAVGEPEFLEASIVFGAVAHRELELHDALVGHPAQLGHLEDDAGLSSTDGRAAAGAAGAAGIVGAGTCVSGWSCWPAPRRRDLRGRAGTPQGDGGGEGRGEA